MINISKDILMFGRLHLFFYCLSLFIYGENIFAKASEDIAKSVKRKSSSKIDDLEKKMESIDFNKIRKILNNDMLEGEVSKKMMVVKKNKSKRIAKVKSKYDFPPEGLALNFFSELWLVKNAMVLKWDVTKPDYGLDISFKKFLENLGAFQKKFKILLVETPIIPHFPLPSNKGEYILILSIPFIRSLDLSKLEISLLLYEDMVRNDRLYFSKFVRFGTLEKLFGSNFQKKIIGKGLFSDVMKKYDQFIFDKGFNFQQQFEVTNVMKKILKNNLKLWSVYLNMLRKIDLLTKTNILYSGYAKMFPSPELQLKWLLPKKKIL